MIGLVRRGRRGATVLSTRRMRLVPMTCALLSAENHDTWQLAQMLGAQLAPDWPPELWEPPVRAHIVAELTAKPETLGWHRYMLLQDGRKPMLVGCLGAFPCAAGDVELGYSVAGSQQRQGLATEAAEALMAWLFQQPAIHSVSAQAYETSPASVRVMQRCGMRLMGAGDEAGTVKYRRWRA